MSSVKFNGCYNRQPFKKAFMVQDGWTEDGRRRMVSIDNVNTMDCQYSKTTPDARCGDCSWKRQSTQKG